MKEENPLDLIVATVAECGGSVTKAAEKLKVSKQVVSKRLHGVRVVHEQWSRRNGNNGTQKVFEKSFRDGFAERVVQAVSHLVRKTSKVQEEIAIYKERLEDMRARAEAAKVEVEESSKRASSLEEVGGLNRKSTEAKSMQEALEAVAQNVQTLIGERKLELDRLTKDLRAATRGAVLAFRENVRRDEFLERLRAVQAMNRAFSKVVSEELIRLGKDRGVPIHLDIMDQYEIDPLPAGDELGSVIRALEKTLSAQEQPFKTTRPHPLMHTKE